MPDKNLKSFFCRSSFLIEIVVVVAGLLALVSLVSSIAKTCTQEPPRVVKNLYFEDIDSLKKDTDPVLSDRKMLEELWKNQKYLYSQHDNLLSDMRQETNNSIVKITTELNFWIAILAILGVLVPIVMVFKGENEAKNWLEKKDRNFEDRLKNYIENANHRLTGWEAKFEAIKSANNKELEAFRNTRNSIAQAQTEIDLQMSVSSLSSIRNNRFLESENELKKAYEGMAKETIKKFFRIFQMELQSDALQDDEKRWSLIGMSMHFYEILRNLNLSHSGALRPRHIFQAEDAAKTLIKAMMEDLPDKSAIENHFEEVKKKTSVVLKNL